MKQAQERHVPLNLHEEHGRFLGAKGHHKSSEVEHGRRRVVPVAFVFTRSARPAVDSLSCSLCRYPDTACSEGSVDGSSGYARRGACGGSF